MAIPAGSSSRASSAGRHARRWAAPPRRSQGNEREGKIESAGPESRETVHNPPIVLTIPRASY